MQYRKKDSPGFGVRFSTGGGGRFLAVLLGVILGVGLISPLTLQTALAAADDDAEEQSGPDATALEERIRQLEEEIGRLKEEIESLRSGGAGQKASLDPRAFESIERKIEALTHEIERLKIGDAAMPEAELATFGLGPAAAKIYGAKKGVTIGGYGEMVYQNFDSKRDNGLPSGKTDQIDFLRAVFYFGYKFSDRFLFNSEIEIEHAQAGEGKEGEVAVEFAYLDYKATSNFGARGGMVLLPIGFINELHEPPIFFGSLRPEVERNIIPTTWRENGAGVYGNAGPVTYRAYIVAGLDASDFTASSWIRNGRQSGSKALAEDFALTARVDYIPTPGLLFGASAYVGDAGQGDPTLGDAKVTLYEAHAEWDWRGLRVRGLYTAGEFAESAAAVLSGAGAAIGTEVEGWYGEAAYNLLSPVDETRQALYPFIRYESYDTQKEVAPGFMADPANDRIVRTYGLSYLPIPNVAIKLDYQNRQNGAGTAVDQVNLALGYLF